MTRPALIVAVAAVVVLAPIASGSGSAPNLTCGGKMSVLIWPNGHPVIKSVNFPAILNPHVEVYVGTNAKYPESRYAGYVVGGKPQGQIPGGDINAACLNYGDVPKATATVVGGVTYRSKIGLRCTFSGAGVMDLIERPKGARVLLFHRGKRILLRADATPTKASVTVPKGACTRQSLPH